MKDRNLAIALGVTIRSARLEKHCSQATLAQRGGIQRASLAAIERGEKAITVETARKLALALDMPLSRLFQRLEEAVGFNN